MTAIIEPPPAPSSDPVAPPVVTVTPEAPAPAQVPTRVTIERDTGERSVLQWIGIVILSILKWIVITVVALFVALLVLISLLSGPTHWAVALLLAAAWVGLVALLVIRPTRLGTLGTQLVATLSFLLLGVITVGVSQLSAYTPAIVDAQGNPVPGSIATLQTVKLGGSDEWITIRGKSVDNPVLIFLAGGPGGSQMAAARHALQGLEDHFVVVQWDQPGAAKSFDSVDRVTLTPERYITDAHELILYLNQRFGEKKVYLAGESWGSALGIMVAQRYPELIYAFMGTGQMVDFTQCDLICYQWDLDRAQRVGDTGKVAQLQAQGPPPYYGNDVAWKEAAYLIDTLTYMNEDPAIYHNGDTIRDLLSPEYGFVDKVNWLRGPLDTLNHVYPHLWGVDFRKEAATLQVPVYFLIGRHDVNAPVSLTEDYYRVLQAPHKEIVWFEHSGHGPWVQESDKYVDTIVNKVLPETYSR